MGKLRVVVGLATVSAILIAAFGAASATGQTAFTCTGSGGCETKAAEESESVAFTGSTSVTGTNDGNFVLTIPSLHGFTTVTVTCTTVSGAGTVTNSESVSGMKAAGSGRVAFSGCTSNQSGCATVTINEAEVAAESLETLVESGMGMRFRPKTAGANFTTITFNGTCGLHSFGAIPIGGTVTATAKGEPDGVGAKAVFTKGMSALIIAEQAATLEGTATFKGENGNRLILRTPTGQTAFTCARVGTGKGGDPNCETKPAEEFEAVAFTGSTPLTAVADGSFVLTVPNIHGLVNVTVTCATVSGTGTVANSETAAVMKATGSGRVKFTGCTTNQTGCTSVTIPEANIAADSIGSEMGLKFIPQSANFTTITFNGTCGLHAFGAIPIGGAVTATAKGEPNGIGAKAIFTKAMSGLSIAGELATLEGTATFKGENGNQLILETG
jgi:hypothetical protein